MADNTNQISNITETELTRTLQNAWVMCYHRLIPKDADRASDELETYKAWLEWWQYGQMSKNPLYNITFGYCLGCGLIQDDISQHTKEFQAMFNRAGHQAIVNLIEELEQENDS